MLGALLLAVGVGMLWSALLKLERPSTVAHGARVALWVAGAALVAKELLFRYMLAMAKRVKSSMLVANAWHARSDAASSLVVGIGIVGNLAGYPILDPIAALIVGFMVAKMGWDFGWDALHDLMDRAVDEQEVEAIRRTLLETPGVSGVHDVRTRKMGDMIVVDAHIEVDAAITVEAGHDIAVAARQRVLQRHRVLNLMTHVDPWRRPSSNFPTGRRTGCCCRAHCGRRRRSSSTRRGSGHTRSTGCRRAGAVRESRYSSGTQPRVSGLLAASGYSTASEVPVVLK